MKHKNIIYTLLIMIGIGMSSCNDFLDKLPDNRTELDTEQKIAKLLVSAYPDATANALFELYSDNTDDNGARYPYYKIAEEDCYSWKDTQEEYQDTPNYLWEAYYGAIAAANMVLDAIQQRGNPASLAPQQGEALICRAYSHFMLANSFL